MDDEPIDEINDTTLVSGAIVCEELQHVLESFKRRVEISLHDSRC